MAAPRRLQDIDDYERENGAQPVTTNGKEPATGANTRTEPDWPEPKLLPGAVWPVPKFDPDLLPEALRGWLVDISDRAQCPIEYVAVGAIVGLGAVIGRRHFIHPKRHDDWKVIPNLWGAAVGPPGVMKTPALKESIKPLDRLVMQAKEDHKVALADFEFKQTVMKAKRDQVQADIKKAIKDGTDPEEHRAKLAECELQTPTERRYIVNDSTVEKLGELLNHNPNGLLLFRDELMGFLRSFDRDGHESARAFYLEAWNGEGSFTYDRIGRGTLYIESACVSILGGIQPGPLEEYLGATARGGGGDDGLMQRFQLLVSPDVVRDFVNVDRFPDTAAKNRAFAVYERLATTQAPEGWKFSRDAQDLFDHWRTALELRLRDLETAPAMALHLAKYRSLMPSLALIFHLAEDDGGGMVSSRAAQMAIRWCELLEAHAMRVYQPITNRATRCARLIADKITSRRLAASFLAREIARAQWSGLTEREDIEHALELLEDHGWLRSRTVSAGTGRPKVEWSVNPRVVLQ